MYPRYLLQYKCGDVKDMKISVLIDFVLRKWVKSCSFGEKIYPNPMILNLVTGVNVNREKWIDEINLIELDR